ncbi:methyl-accepting chemotaxis protein [Defluviitalea saccharophila]|uniref:Methyl-accepting chemotaxis protein n=1 Tax=Defluviitalea saccharophila TaxID=879970 RepID=A0ABZ2Y6R1_9FIRM|nr:methyl-accepting chemotaxis protein [Candidatus Epulonipiscium sp.]
MNFINNLKTKTKLLVVFAFILIITILININGRYTAKNLQNSLETFYNDNFLSNLILGEIQVNQEKAVTEIQRILYKTEALHNPAVIEASLEELNRLMTANELLIKDYESKDLLPEEIELLDRLKTTNTDYEIVKEKVINAAKSGDFKLAAEINDKHVRELGEEISGILAHMKELNNQIAIDIMSANKEKFNRTRNFGILSLVIACLVCLGLIILLNRMITKPIKTLVEYANRMAEGDFTYDVPENILRRKDEMGMLAGAFASMNEKIHAMLKEVSVSAEESSSASEELAASAEEVTAQGESIATSIQQIAEGMEEISFSIEEIAKGGLEINNRVQLLERKAIDGEEKVNKIKNRAEEMKDTARLSKQTANDIYNLKQKEIKLAIEEVGIVEEITKMADVISEIAEQTNLLALNAAIEAARAGEQGRGFAVVAEEVRKLAEHSANTAAEIHQVIRQVYGTVEKLIANAEEILKFIDEKVAPDYDMLEKTGEQYAEDARFVKSLTNDFAAAAYQILNSVEEINDAIGGVSATVEEATASAQEISGSSLESTKALEEVARTAQSQAEMAERLSTMVARFKV